MEERKLIVFRSTLIQAIASWLLWFVVIVLNIVLVSKPVLRNTLEETKGPKWCWRAERSLMKCPMLKQQSHFSYRTKTTCYNGYTQYTVILM